MKIIYNAIYIKKDLINCYEFTRSLFFYERLPFILHVKPTVFVTDVMYFPFESY